VQQEDYSPVITDFMQRFGIFVQSFQLYAPDNENMVRNISKLRDALNLIFPWRNPFSLAIIRERLYFEEFQMKSRFPLVMTLIDIMLDRLIRKVIFNKDVEDRELLALAEVLNTQPVKLRDIGGPQIMLAVDCKVTNISFFELSSFAPDEIANSGSWQSAVHRAGLEVGEVAQFMKGPDKGGYVVEEDTTDDLYMRGSQLMRREVFQLIELLVNPRVLAGMVLELAAVETAEGRMIDPAEVVRILTRAENTLLFRSAYAPQKIGEHLGEALKLMDHSVRVGVLEEYLRKRSEGLHWPNLDLFQFAPPEWADALWNLSREDEGEEWLGQVTLPRGHWEQVVAHWKQQLARPGRLDEQQVKKIASRLLVFHPRGAAPKSPGPLLDEVLQQSASIQHQETLQKRLERLQSELKTHIETGYANTVLGLLQYENEDQRVRQIVNNFFEQIQQMIERKHLEAVTFLSRFRDIISSKDEEKIKMLTTWIRSDGKDFVSKVLKQISNLQQEKNRAAFQEFLPLLRLVDRETMKEMLDKCYFEIGQPDVKLLVELFEPLKFDVIKILDEYLNEQHEGFNPRRFIKGLRLYMAMIGEKSEPLIRKCLESARPPVRMAALLRLAQPDNPVFAKPLLRECLWKPKSNFSSDELVLAAYGLGVLRDKESADSLRKIVEKPKKYLKVARHDPQLAALYAYALIKGPEARSELAKLYKKTKASGISRLIPWK